jgi:hypothetical protein
MIPTAVAEPPHPTREAAPQPAPQPAATTLAFCIHRPRHVRTPHCGGQFKIIAAIVESALIECAFGHLGGQAPGTAAGLGARQS